MRELKFRTWDTENKEFSEWTNRDPFFDTSTGKIFFWERTENEDITLEDHGGRFILQQYTGVKDKNGKEIYEGDIVKTHNDHSSALLNKIFNKDIPDYNRGQIKWVCEAWKVCQKNFGASYLHSFYCCEDCNCCLEIIGNIYENLEL